MVKKTFFVTGGAGFLGINLCRFLLDKKQNVVSYDISDFDYDVKDKVKAIKGDITDYKNLKKAMDGSDIVVHCAAALPLWEEGKIRAVNLKGTENTLKAARELGIKRVIHISSTAVYGIPDHHPLFENDKLEGVGPYGETKVGAEKVCEAYRKKGLCVPILRPKSFLGPERLGVFGILYDWVRRGKRIPIVGNGKNRYQLLDVYDLCNAIWVLSQKPAKIANDTFNIGAEKFGTMEEDYNALLDYAGFGKKVVKTPAKQMIWILRFLEILNLSPLYKWVYETAPEDSYVSIDKAKKKLKWKPKYSNEEALIRTYEWYLDNYDHYEKKTGVTHRVPWKQGILRFFRLFF